MNRYNVIYLHAHDAGRHIQPYGYAAATSHLQQLAEEGMLFRQAFCANPTCSPSRACLLTGQWAHVNGMLGLAHRGFRLNHYEHTLVRHLRDHGWNTALAGIQHIAREPYANPSEIGYHEILPVATDHGPLAVTAAAEAFLARDHEKPFFLDVGYFPPHRSKGGFPALVPAPNPNYVRPPAPLPDTEETRRDYAEYLASVATFDDMAGRVLAALKRNGLEEKTLVICTTDHGIAFPDMKCRLTDHGLGVMLILRGPGGFRGGRASDAMVSQIDLFPTVCEVLDLAVPERVQGVSFMALSENPSQEIRTELFAEVNFHAAYEPMRAIRTKRWKYIRRCHDRAAPVLPNCDDGPSKTLWFQQSWAERSHPEEALYDLVFDPNEASNLAADSSHASVLDDLRQRLDRWMRETDDPILHGPLSAEGKIVTESGAYSPPAQRSS